MPDHKELRDIIKWVIHNGIMSITEKHKEDITDQALSAILKSYVRKDEIKELKEQLAEARNEIEKLILYYSNTMNF